MVFLWLILKFISCNDDIIIAFNETASCVLNINKNFTGTMVFPSTYEDKTIVSIGPYACSGGVLSELDLSKTSLVLIDEYAFFQCTHLTKVIFPETLTTILHNGFAWSSIEYVNYTASMSSINSNSWNQNPVKAFYVPENNIVYKSIDGFLFNKKGTSLLGCPRSITSCNEIPNFDIITSIADCALTLTKLELFTGTENLSTLQYWSFHQTRSMKKIDLSKTTITIIPSSAFSYTGAKEIILPIILKTINQTAFSYCSSLSGIIIPENVTSVKQSAFSNCNNLRNIFYFGKNDLQSPNFFSNCRYASVYVHPLYPYNFLGTKVVSKKWYLKMFLTCDHRRGNCYLMSQIFILFTLLY